MSFVIVFGVFFLFILFAIKTVAEDGKPDKMSKIDTMILLEKYTPIIYGTEDLESLSRLYMEFFNQITQVGEWKKRYFIIDKQFRYEAMELLGVMRDRLIKLTPANNKE